MEKSFIESIREVFFQLNSERSREMVVYTGVAGMKAFNRAMRTEGKRFLKKNKRRVVTKEKELYIYTGF